MRLHHLEVTAFGPFPDTTRVDFDALSQAGLFLLTGPTGAGKSSVLDAVCFALYGDVPGDRASARRLRCDQAAEGVAPRVVLEATLAGRRFRIDRSPAWTRAKRRGTGTTTEQARVVLSERVDGAWQPLSTRLDETGHLVSHLVGMTLAQFCQVALLPQGRFQAFLRARSEERHALLQQVFRTGRFDQVEKWLRDRRVQLRRASQAHEEAVADLVSRVSEVADTAPPEDWQEGPDALLAWHGSLLADTSQATDRSGHALEEATAELDAASAADRDAQQLAELQRRHRDAAAELARLAAQADEVDRARDRLDLAARAATVRPLADLAEAAVRREQQATARLTEALATASAARGEVVHADRLADVHGRATAALADVTRVRPVHQRCAEARTALAARTVEAASAREDLERVLDRAQRLPDELDEARRVLADAEAAESRATELADRVDGLRARLSAHTEAGRLAVALDAAEADHRTTVTSLQAAKELWLDIREQRLEGMAAEIATGLVVGGCCPVCGSAEHPSPAAARSGAPDAAAERAARREVDDLEAAAEARSQHVRDLDARLAAARARAGDDPAGLPSAIAGAETALAEVQDLARGLVPARARHEALLAEQAAAGAELDRARAVLVAHEAEVTRLHALAAELQAQVDAVLTDSGHDDLDALAAHHAAVEEACTRAEELLDAVHRARHAREEALDAAGRAARDAGFASVAEGAEGVLDAERRDTLEAAVAAHRRAHDVAEHALADPELAAAADRPAPDLALVADVHARAREAAAAARRTHDVLTERRRRLHGLGAELTDAVHHWQPVRDELALTASMAAFVEGKSPDNRLQMRLSAYVLSHRLAQVVAAANLRLAAMSDQRYSLVHTGRRGAGESRGGLSLLVRDDWSGESRDPATLSGGETFVVSLALALGLADVISAEAGGADLDTLFVDEGFGSLDADTLDDVMDTLDSLRDGGRVVGVVSHVPELQTRIPTQLRVHKARHGSRTSLRVANGLG